jgi:AcrR family transcriptional regulator
MLAGRTGPRLQSPRMDAKPDETAPTARRGYHHGALKAAMVEAAVALVQERGADAVTVREAARRAGVSSGAPFRHFPNRTALMTAAAEEAMRRFRAEIDAAMAEAAGEDALVRFSALALAYLRWSVRNPALFEILGNRRSLDLARAPQLQADLATLSDLVIKLLTEARDAGLLRSDDVFYLALNARTMAYGMSHMLIDQQLEEWGIDDALAEAAMAAAMRHYLRGIAADPDRHAFRV